jgi:hypothetical protein
MRIGFHRVHRRSRGLLVLALIALSFLLARPVCAAWGSHGELAAATSAAMHVPATDSGDHELCCSSMDDGASATPSAAKMPDAKAPPAVALPFASRLLAVNRTLPGTASPRALPPRPLDYHARSARMLS